MIDFQQLRIIIDTFSNDLYMNTVSFEQGFLFRKNKGPNIRCKELCDGQTDRQRRDAIEGNINRVSSDEQLQKTDNLEIDCSKSLLKFCHFV